MSIKLVHPEDEADCVFVEPGSAAEASHRARGLVAAEELESNDESGDEEEGAEAEVEGESEQAPSSGKVKARKATKRGRRS